MTSKTRLLTPLLLAGVSLWSPGCSEETIDSPEPISSAPASFIEGDTKWTRFAEIPHQLEERVAGYVRNNPSIAENPRLKGAPQLYLAEDGRDRFYWLTKSSDDVEWLYVEYFEGKFMDSNEGTGLKGLTP